MITGAILSTQNTLPWILTLSRLLRTAKWGREWAKAANSHPQSAKTSRKMRKVRDFVLPFKIPIFLTRRSLSTVRI